MLKTMVSSKFLMVSGVVCRISESSASRLSGNGYVVTFHACVVALADAELGGDVFLGEVSQFAHLPDFMA